MPESFSQFKSMKKVNIARNNFEGIPSVLGKLQSLEWLATFGNSSMDAGDIFKCNPRLDIVSERPFTERTGIDKHKVSVSA